MFFFFRLLLMRWAPRLENTKIKRPRGFVCVVRAQGFCVSLQVGGVWRDNLPPAQHGRLSSIRVPIYYTNMSSPKIPWAPFLLNISTPHHGPFLVYIPFELVLFFPWLFIFFFHRAVFLQRQRAYIHGRPFPATDKSEFSLLQQGDGDEQKEESPTRWCCPHPYTSREEEPFKPIENDKSLISPFQWKSPSHSRKRRWILFIPPTEYFLTKHRDML